MPMRVSSITGEVRAFAKEDIPQVADLHRRVFRVADHTSQELLDSYRTYFTQVFLEGPWRDFTLGDPSCSALCTGAMPCFRVWRANGVFISSNPGA